METEYVSEILGTFLPLTACGLVFSLLMLRAFSLNLMVNRSQSNKKSFCQGLKTRAGTSSQILCVIKYTSGNGQYRTKLHRKKSKLLVTLQYVSFRNSMCFIIQDHIVPNSNTFVCRIKML